MSKEDSIEVKKEETSVDTFISQAIAGNLPVETMEKLFVLKEKYEAGRAKEAFTKAMASFQKACPIIEKKNPVKNKNGNVVYHFADLGTIVAQVKTPLAENNLSYEFITEDKDKFLNVTCIVTHALGHSKQSSFQIPIGTEAYMTDAQKYGARLTFAKRYAFCNALGILTADEDVDSNTEDKQNKISKDLEDSIKNTMKIEDLEAIWVKNKGLGKEFAKLIVEQKKFILSVEKDEKNA